MQTNTSAQVILNAGELILKDSAGTAIIARSIPNIIGDITLSGVSGLDTGAEAASTWYGVRLIVRTTPYVAQAVTASSATDRITLTAHGLPANAPVVFAGTLPGGLSAATAYYLRDVTANDFKVAATPNGAAIDLTSDGSSVTMSDLPAVLFTSGSGGATMPAGYDGRALIGMVRNDSGSNFIGFHQRDFRTWIAEQLIFTAFAGVTTYTAQSIASAVPPNAVSVTGMIGVSSAVTKNVGVSANSAGTLGVMHKPGYSAGDAGTFSGWFAAEEFNDLPMITAQTLFWIAEDTNAEYRMTITGFLNAT
jgi:hypothetical protein